MIGAVKTMCANSLRCSADLRIGLPVCKASNLSLLSFLELGVWGFRLRLCVFALNQALHTKLTKTDRF
jgi:hypothetical protein